MEWYVEGAADDHWDRHWLGKLDAKAYEKSRQGHLGPFRKPFLAHLPREGKILEAGCGMARKVVALRARGYDCEGVDTAAATVAAVRGLMPELPVSVGDAARLPVPDGYYRGYISLGVVEHRREGPEAFLDEAWRVLAPGGTAYFSVPFLNSLRRLKGLLGLYGSGAATGSFYQYAFTIAEMKHLLEIRDFEVVALHGYGSWQCLKDELPPLAWLHRIPRVRGAYRMLTGVLPGCDRYVGHMMGFICRRAKQ